MFLDSFGLITQTDGDGGDTLHREGMFWFGFWFNFVKMSNYAVAISLPRRGEPSSVLQRLEPSPGIWIRHPDTTKWYSDPQTTSRDQLKAAIAYLGAFKEYKKLWQLFVATAKRGFFAQNVLRNWGQPGKKIPDEMFSCLSLFIRAGGKWTWPLYPLLLAFDLLNVLATILESLPVRFEDDALLPRLKSPDDVDDNNLVIQHLIAVAWKPTPFSWLARTIYSTFRSKNFGNTILKEENAVMGALVWYHRADNKGNPDLAEMYRSPVEKYFQPLTLTRIMTWLSESLSLANRT